MCNINNCNQKKKYGNYCYKHRDKYLLNSNNMINFNKFTYKIKDYKVIDIKKTLKFYNINIKNKKKNELYEILLDILIKNIDIKKINKIIKIQSHIRKFITNIKLLKGIGFYNKKICKNDEDFYNFVNINEIEDKYFFSYKDTKNNIWFFDIRSFNKLITNDNKNPYTRDIIPNKAKETAIKLSKYLKYHNININIEELIHKNIKDRIKQKTVDLISNISQSGYDINIEWFLSLNIIKIKKLYKLLEDIWNYRAYLTNETKSRIAPPNGIVFYIPVRDIYLMTNKYEIMEIILNDISKFNNGITIGDKQQGFMYFLIALSDVSIDCFNTHSWWINYVQ